MSLKHNSIIIKFRTNKMLLPYNGKNAIKNQNTTTKYIHKYTHYNKIKTKMFRSNRAVLQNKSKNAAKKSEL